ncbi:hypothetical protein EDC01DRAFT_650530 [Geopyxis carbonaria]|nr:hypothetical protein EDC01DRAFT_650530 [Geopyxis carbonaria]
MSELGRRDNDERAVSMFSPMPPPHRTMLDDRPTLLVTYWCVACSIVLILFRCAGRMVRIGRLYRDDKLMMLTMIPMLIRLACVHVVLTFGTNNVDVTGISDDEAWRRQIGSKVVLAARVFYPAYIWSQKFCITEFYVRLTTHLYERNYRIGLKMIRWSLLVTFLAVVVTVFAECQPTHKYWQVRPDPGARCRQGYIPLFSMGTLSNATDILLVFCTMPAIIRSSLETSKKIRLIATFSLSLLSIGLTSFRIHSVLDRRGAQPYRTLLASFDTLLATFVANAIIINSFARHRGEKRNKFRFVRDMTESPVAHRRLRAWGSDDDLAGSLAGRPSDSSFSPAASPTAPAPAPPRRAMTVSPHGSVSVGELFKRTNSDITLVAGGYQYAGNSPRNPKLRDVGGLLDAQRRGHRRSRSAPPVDELPEHAEVALVDVGGLLALKEMRRSRSLSFDEDEDEDAESDGSSPVELQDLAQMLREDHGHLQPVSPPPREGDTPQLSDVGGLLGTNDDDGADALEMKILKDAKSPR